MTVTIKEVAKKAGVSLSTVSLVLNNKKNVSEETRFKILRIIEELNYHPRRIARGLASKRSGNIGFILTDDHFSRAEPFYTKIFLGAEFEAREHKYYILLTTINDSFKPSKHSTVPRFLLEKNVDGIILAGKVPDNLIDYIYQKNLPFVFVDYHVTHFKIKNVSAVLIDNVQGGYNVASYLIELGHNKIGFIGGEINHPSIRDRFQGFKECHKNANIPLDEKLIIIDEPNTGTDNGYNAVKKMLNMGRIPTALFFSNDTMAIGGMKYFKEQGYKIPEDISIIGFDDIEAAYQTEPPLTTMKVFKEEIGALAIEELVKLIEKKSKIHEKKMVPVELVVRGSCRRLS